ncbi:DNA topoisomerase VI subunit A [Candidatus Mancarchaeum acidiphilum]|uniref:DNA topoisomerase (ATP-hydrolyzing) n=1 Tax=Candidatus Mancarchaeum acidiphilum TaxID=1920749 RepID=A0A218NN38_9ARCH|nr:DNA topoisomerase IV subunit A [Candidatus Mancarchaeum acidiphilum]ASI13881.1 DNA topoisomerase VI subunit A [Candidatus Mancarchaeum acidiphilum]
MPDESPKTRITEDVLREFGNMLIRDIFSDKNPSFQTSVRSRTNVVFDKSKGFLTLGDSKEEHSFINVSQSKGFMQTIAIAAKCYSFIKQNQHATIRDLFYQLKYSLGDDLDENIFNEQSESNPLIEDLEVALDLRREQLNLNANRKGVLVGNMRIIDKFGDETVEIDGAKTGRSGWAIPSDVDNDIQFVDIDADYVLVVEKDALWYRLNEDKFWKKENAIIISPMGQAARGTRRLIRKLSDKGLPIYVFNDCDAWGWYIYWTIKTGSINLAYISDDLATPKAKFIGVTMSDLEAYPFLKGLTMKANDMDIKKAQEMLNYPWISRYPEWVNELNLVLKMKKKLEQNSLEGPKLSFVDEYINDKIKKGNFLP